MTTVGYGDITGVRIDERVFTMMTEVFGIIWYAVLVSTGVQILKEIDTGNAYLKKELGKLYTLFKLVTIAPDLKLRVKRSYLEYLTNDGYRDSEDLIQQLPKVLQTDVRLHIYSRRIQTLSAVVDFEDSFLGISTFVDRYWFSSSKIVCSGI